MVQLYKHWRTVSFEILTLLGDNFLGLALLIPFTSKNGNDSFGMHES